MSLAPGRTLLNYRLIDKIGEGGMGVVWKALDTTLDREVAIKVLPEAFSADVERLARFEREARLLASLNHPNIAAVYGLHEAAPAEGSGQATRFLAMELVAGEDLAERLRRGPLDSETALEVARQVAEALEAAHKHGIVHRDLKPANVKIDPDGKVKVLDFGLAKALEGEPGSTSGDPSMSPTITSAGTVAGMILGTAAYMSPEQARGRRADHRSDVWAFGCLLYELLSGRLAFPGETVSDTLAAVLAKEPDWEALPADCPAALRALIRRCMRKEQRTRVQSIGDVRIAVDEIASGEVDELTETASGAIQGGWRRHLPWGLVALLALVVAGLAWSLSRFPAPGGAGRPAWLEITLPDRYLFSPENGYPVAFSPDGTKLALVATDGKTTQLFVRRLDRPELLPVAGTDGADSPFFSPDGGWVAFNVGTRLKKVSLDNGTVLDLCEAEWGRGAWGSDGTIFFSRTYNEGLWRVAADGGEPEMLTAPDRERGELGHFWPQILPGSEWLLFTNFAPQMDHSRIEVLLPGTGERKVLVEGAMFGRYAPTGHLLFARDDNLLAARFDLEALEVIGPAVPVVPDVALNRFQGNLVLSLSDEGSLAFVPASTLNPERWIVWVSRDGDEQPVVDTARRYFDPSVSPDGRRLALSILEESRDLWIRDLERGTLSRLTFDSTSEFNPLWTPDGRQILFNYDRPPFDIYRVPADGGAAAVPVVTNEFDKTLSDVSPDGKLLVYTQSDPGSGSDIWLLPLDGGAEPERFSGTPFDDSYPTFSRDGRWLAYQSDEAGRNEIYVQAVSSPGGKQQVSVDGGSRPAWSHDGSTLFYRNGERMMAVSIDTTAELEVGQPTVLFEGRYDHYGTHRGYDVTADGRFVMIRTPQDSIPRRLIVVLNWFEELQRLTSGS